MGQIGVSTIEFDSLAADPSPLSDGMMWYRSDLDEFRSYNNGVIESIGSGGGPTRDNHVLVKSLADLPTPVVGVITLADNTSYEINGLVVVGSNRIVTGVSNLIYGIDKSDDALVYTGTGDFITSTNKDLSIRSVSIVSSAVGSKCINISGDGTNRLEIAEGIFANSAEIGTITGGFATIVIRGNLWTGNTLGLSITGVSDDFFFTDNVIDGFLGTATALSIQGSVTYHTIIIDRNMFEIAVGQIGLDIDPNITFTGGGFISNNSFEDGGTYLNGIDASNQEWRIPPRSNVGVPGLFVGQFTVVLSSWITTSGSYIDIPETISIGTASDYEPNATTIEARMVASISHEQSGQNTAIQLYNKTNESLVAGTEIVETIDVANVFEVVSNNSFTPINGDTEYRIGLRRATGSGQNDSIIRSGVIEVKIY